MSTTSTRSKRHAGRGHRARSAAHPHHRAAAYAPVHRPAGDVGQPRDQPVRPAHRSPDRDHGGLGPAAIGAIVVGCGLGALLLGASAIFGATTGAPAMVALRGLVGRRGSVVPTVLNIGQNVGWATMEIIVISTAAVAVLGAGLALAVRPRSPVPRRP